MSAHVLLAVDLLKGSHSLSLKALTMAEKLNAKLSIIHIVETPLPNQYAHALGFAELIEPSLHSAKAVLATLADELEIPSSQQYTFAGKASFLITEQAKKLGVNTLIIGAQGENNLPHLLGSTANSILHKAHCDVLTIKTQTPSKG